MNVNWKHHPSHGFRFSLTDALAIVACIFATVWGRRELGVVAWLFPFVLGHFFLFCNIFRVPRKPELIWASAFLVIVSGCLIADASILHSLWLVLPITVAVLVYAIRLPTYHGVGSQKLTEEDTKLPD
ncbi:hypothetical protein LOC67_10345 [Stieleria sp. JC731]|uniref:hypothetical protein n=1 Tax=Pirellulaceae TaxID=2691357 RepID=UPI001E5B6FBE|nr:hypothetical protein [Stieleria sp. JC731]MCC9600967.1 hypothetical protein [Stieleria sp. JC731]